MEDNYEFLKSEFGKKVNLIENINFLGLYWFGVKVHKSNAKKRRLKFEASLRTKKESC